MKGNRIRKNLFRNFKFNSVTLLLNKLRANFVHIAYRQFKIGKMPLKLLNVILKLCLRNSGIN